MPMTMVGANINGKPNYITIAHVGIMDLGSVSLAMNRVHYTNDGIKENKTFSVNIPSISMVKETDYCGLVSGKDVDKAALFSVYYGELVTAPMITECPLSFECRLQTTVENPTNNLYIGEIIASYTEEKYLTEGKPDIKKLNPLLLTMPDNRYWTVGEYAGDAWSIGKNLIRK